MWNLEVNSTDSSKAKSNCILHKQEQVHLTDQANNRTDLKNLKVEGLGLGLGLERGTNKTIAIAYVVRQFVPTLLPILRCGIAATAGRPKA